jgi:hypothetical protein
VTDALELVRRWGRARVAAALLMGITVVVLAVRLPTAFDDLQAARSADVGRNEAGGALAVADTLSIDNDFMRAAVELVRAPARFAVLYPSAESAATTYNIAPITLEALQPLMQEVLLPAREEPQPVRGGFLLCYVCDTGPWDARTHWLWRDGKGAAIGRVYR